MQADWKLIDENTPSDTPIMLASKTSACEGAVYRRQSDGGIISCTLMPDRSKPTHWDYLPEGPKC